jgi:hypothetical protein
VVNADWYGRASTTTVQFGMTSPCECEMRHLAQLNEALRLSVSAGEERWQIRSTEAVQV